MLTSCAGNVDICAGILEQSMGARNREGKELSYTGPPGYIKESIPVLLKSLKIPSLKSAIIPGNGERCALLSLPVNCRPGHEHGSALRNGGGKEAGGERGQVESVHAHCARALAKQGHLRAFIITVVLMLFSLSKIESRMQS